MVESEYGVPVQGQRIKSRHPLSNGPRLRCRAVANILLRCLSPSEMFLAAAVW